MELGASWEVFAAFGGFSLISTLGADSLAGPGSKIPQKGRNTGGMFCARINVRDNALVPKYTKYEAKRSNIRSGSLTQIVSDWTPSSSQPKLPIPERLIGIMMAAGTVDCV